MAKAQILNADEPHCLGDDLGGKEHSGALSARSGQVPPLRTVPRLEAPNWVGDRRERYDTRRKASGRHGNVLTPTSGHRQVVGLWGTNFGLVTPTEPYGSVISDREEPRAKARSMFPQDRDIAASSGSLGETA